MPDLLNKIICGDCIEVLRGTTEPFADLIFADPPFNIGYKYDNYHDKVKGKNYVEWTSQWMSECKRVLKPDGSFYIAIGDEHAADVKKIADDISLSMRNWIIWYYSFGQQLKRKFARAHTHIFYFVKDKRRFTFNDDQVRVISDRQRVYKDKRANPQGKMPDDVWDEYPRVCGTFKERTDFPCQMPESLLARIIRLSSRQGDWVLDPFSGSGTTAVVAHKLNRIYTAIDISQEYVRQSRARIAESEGLPIEGEGTREWTEHLESELKWLYHENKVSTEQLQKDHALLTLFTDKFNSRAGAARHPFRPQDIAQHLTQMRKAGTLGPLRGHPVVTHAGESRSHRTLWESAVPRKHRT